MTPLPECPSFSEFFQAVNGYEPFPWQEQLATRFQTGALPDLVEIPTGLGKTGCIDVMVWALAHQAELAPTLRTAPTRLWWVVNRRVLVDDTYSHSERIVKKLSRPGRSEALQAVAARLTELAGGPAVHHGLKPVPLEALRLRAGAYYGRPRHPAQPAVISTTLPMYGSRLLFRGYGASKFQWPLDAALAAYDSLVVIEEPLISGYLRQLLDDLTDWAMNDNYKVIPARPTPVVMQVTATPTSRTESVDRITLTEADKRHPLVDKYLRASKPVEVVETSDQPVKALCAAFKASDLDTHRRALVFVNSPGDALEIVDTLRKGNPSYDVLLATGRIRDAEGVIVANDIGWRLGAGVDTSERRPVVVVATSTLEVGADLDADLLITEQCDTRALLQRLGRLNRRGDFAHARGVYVACKEREWSPYGDDQARVLERLNRKLTRAGTVNLSPSNAPRVLGAPPDVSPDAPVLSDAVLQEWTKTTTPPRGEAPVEPYFIGYKHTPQNVYIIWRLHVPKPGERLWPPAVDTEAITVSTSTLQHFLQEVPKKSVRLLSHDRLTVEAYSFENVTPSTTVVVPTGIGGLRPDGHFSPASTSSVADLSLFKGGLPITASALKELEGTSSAPAKALIKAVGSDSPVDEQVRDYIEHLASHSPPTFKNAQAIIGEGHWQWFVDMLRDEHQRRIDASEPSLSTPHGSIPYIPVPVPERLIASVPIESDYSRLDVHGVLTGARAEALASALGLPERLTAVVRRAAEMHDLGKSEERFQAWINPEFSTTKQVLVHSTQPGWATDHQRRVVGYPKDGRHEEHSRRLVEAWLEAGRHDFSDSEADLLQHLVVSHHGRGRPMVVPVADVAENLIRVSHRFNGIAPSVEASLAVADWEQPARFASLVKQYGPWGLAMLETVVRQAISLSFETMNESVDERV